MSLKRILLNNRQYNTLFKNNINNEINIRKILTKSGNSKIFYNSTKNPKVLLKVRNLEKTNNVSLKTELKAFSKIRNYCPNIVHKINSFVIDMDLNTYENNNNGSVVLGKKINGQKIVTLSILALEYVDGYSLDDIELNIEQFKDVIIQLFCVFYSMRVFGVEISDTNLNNIIFKQGKTTLNYEYLFREKIIVNNKIVVIDLDHVKFGNPMVNNYNLLSFIFSKDNFFFKFFNKFFNRYDRLRIFIQNLRNYLFDDIYQNLVNKKIRLNPLDIINIIRNFR